MGRGRFIQVHGTSGSGKTTLMRWVIEHFQGVPGGTSLHEVYHKWTEKKTGKAKERSFLLGTGFIPVGEAPQWRPHFICGSYSAVCGGLDSLSAPGIADSFYPKLKGLADEGYDILMEGLIQMSTGRAIDLVQCGYDVDAIFLDTPLETCIERINQRRAAAGKGPLENLENTTIKFNDKPRIAAKLQAAGAIVNWLNSDAAYARIMEMLRA